MAPGRNRTREQVFPVLTPALLLPEPPWPEEGPVLIDGVLPDLNVQSNLSDVSCVQAEHHWPSLKSQVDAVEEVK